MGLEAIEQIEIITAELVAEVFGARYAEIRVASGALANLYAFIATCAPGDTIIAPPPSIGGHVTHHAGGSAGQYHLNTVPAPVCADGYTVDVNSLRTLAHQTRPKLITIGSSLNLYPHPVGTIREIADEVGAKVLFDAAHLCGLIAGKAWQQPLDEGAHMITFSTYKSLGGPAGGAIVTNDADLAERIDKIAFPGLTANFDAAKTAALAVTMIDWKVAGPAYAATMVETAARLADELAAAGLPVFTGAHGATRSHQFAIRAHGWGGGQHAAHRLRKANLLACGIGLPAATVNGDVNGLRIGTPELVRLGMKPDDMTDLAGFIASGLNLAIDPATVAPEVTAWRKQFAGVHYTATGLADFTH
jgi:glycine hydroxymethyltransferase